MGAEDEGLKGHGSSDALQGKFENRLLAAGLQWTVCAFFRLCVCVVKVHMSLLPLSLWHNRTGSVQDFGLSCHNQPLQKRVLI